MRVDQMGVDQIGVDQMGVDEMGGHQRDYDVLYAFVAFKRYPTGSSKNQRRIIRRKCNEHFSVQEGVLYYS